MLAFPYCLTPFIILLFDMNIRMCVFMLHVQMLNLLLATSYSTNDREWHCIKCTKDARNKNIICEKISLTLIHNLANVSLYYQ